jgi:hypothetical protein
MCFSRAGTNFTSLILFSLEHCGSLIFIFRVNFVICKIYVFLTAYATEDANEVWNVQC